MEDLWGNPLYLKGIAIEGQDLIEIGYEFRECQLCGVPVSEEMQPTHERYHACQDLPPTE
ncbi:hypothetical protein QFZ22_003780 [Streptomyces canus]|uniref:C2H2-type domain-containing protein n=1 Tax=Streptomyces canus TaxID=58343 RepID=A0AAW8FFF6_9ACTN|nr:hypothetical protein [Streptomyces canus]